MKPGIVVLAAGSSSRMGQSKQLLKIGSLTLLEHTCAEACKVSDQVAVVLGSQFEEHRKAVAHLPVLIVLNKGWKKGMGSSIKAGVEFLKSTHPIESLIITVCDQPRLTSEHLLKLIRSASDSGKQIVCSAYGGTRGVPAIFQKSVFKRLIAMDDARGAKALFSELPDLTITVDFPDGAIDLDKPGDYESFTHGSPTP